MVPPSLQFWCTVGLQEMVLITMSFIPGNLSGFTKYNHNPKKGKEFNKATTPYKNDCTIKTSNLRLVKTM